VVLSLWLEDGEVPEPQTRTEFRGDYVRALGASARVTAVGGGS